MPNPWDYKYEAPADSKSGDGPWNHQYSGASSVPEPLSGPIGASSDNGVPEGLQGSSSAPIPSASDSFHPVDSVPVGQGPGLLKRIKDIPKTWEANMAPTDQLLAPVVNESAGHPEGSLDTHAQNVAGPAAATLLSPVMHPGNTLLSMAEMTPPGMAVDSLIGRKNPFEQQSDQLSKLDSTAQAENLAGTVSGLLLGKGVAEGVPGSASEISKAIPNAARAGVKLDDLAHMGSRQPVSFQTVSEPLNDVMLEGKSGGYVPRAVDILHNRSNEIAPMHVPEARRIASNISSLSADEKGALTPNVKRLLGGVREGFHTDIANALDRAGQIGDGLGDQYRDALKEYSNAMRLQNIGRLGLKYGLPAVGVGGGLLAGYDGLKKMF